MCPSQDPIMPIPHSEVRVSEGLHRDRSTFGLKMFQENKSLPVSLPLSERIGKAFSKCMCVGGLERRPFIFARGSYLKVILLPVIFLFKPCWTLVLIWVTVISKIC